MYSMKVIDKYTNYYNIMKMMEAKESMLDSLGVY